MWWKSYQPVIEDVVQAKDKHNFTYYPARSSYPLSDTLVVDLVYTSPLMMHVAIVGGGISGLSAALLLQREGNQVTIYQALARLGGRIYTHRFGKRPDGSQPYFEAGAMRIPRSPLHDKVYALVQYLNTNNSPDMTVNLVPYILEHKNNKAFIRGQKLALDDAHWGSIMDLSEPYRGESARALLMEVVSPWLKLLRDDFESGFEKLLEYDEYSFRHYLRAHAKWPHEVVEYVELLCSQTNQYDLSFTELIMQNLDFDTQNWCTVEGGMSNMVDACANLIGRRNIRMNSSVRGIHERPDGKVELQIEGAAGHTCAFDKVLLAIPTAALHSIHQRPTWSFMKEQSLRGAWFEPLHKMGLHFRTRFWEQIPEPSFGGQSTTDLRFRWIVYPSDHMGYQGSGVLLLYCWMSDASKWGALNREERAELALHDLSKYFADQRVDVCDQYIEAFDILWSNEFCGGDAMFLPGQFSRFFEVSREPERNIYFAGEHLSKHHTWIAGALDSALTSVRQMTGEDVPALGREHGPKQSRSGTPQEIVRVTDVLRSRVWSKAPSMHASFIIPVHLNVQYVDVF
ncbi:putative flavin-containing amine oxidase [Xylariales sp. AK1849]|nr:putative flavin-containing amine oxidase [Xylariales sp. AK1849]